jgi:putative ABC transport system ATP-binding protein
MDGYDRIEVLKGVSFSVREGEMVAIMGRSGSGKSTLINIIGGIISPDEGNVLIDEAYTDYSDERALLKLRREKIGFVFQDFALINKKTVLENITFVVRSKNYKDNKYAKVKQLIKDVGMAEKTDKYPFQLSNGERQRVAIVRALVDNKKVILADEPTGALDSENAEKIINILKKKVKEDDRIAIIVTHDSEVAKHCDKIYYMDYGILKEKAL